MKTKKTKTSKTKAKTAAPKNAFHGKAKDAKAALERSRLEAEAKVNAIKGTIKAASDKATAMLEKHIAGLKADHKKRQAKLKKMQKELSAV